MSTLKLEILNTPFKGRLFKFKHDLTVGANATCTVRAQHPGMAPVHARFYLDGVKPMVEIGSEEAHISLNGRDVVRGELYHGDELAVGPLRLRVIDLSRVSQANRIDDLLADYEAHAGDEIHDFAKEDLFYLATKDPSIRLAVSFHIPSKDKFIEQTQVFLARLAKSAGLDEAKADAFMTCAKELVLNAHRHGHKYDESKRITLRYRDLGDRLQLVVADEGPGFDHSKVILTSTSKDAATAARERYLAGGFGGLGFQLITRMADELSYNQAGNEATFAVRKRLAD
jgi:anti-sigma regulatory factor (Ser/Thr protein kinase)